MNIDHTAEIGAIKAVKPALGLEGGGGRKLMAQGSLCFYLVEI